MGRLIRVSHPALDPASARRPDALDDRTGYFVVFEGGDGTGKSTQKSRLHKLLAGLPWVHPDQRIIHTREPGGTPLAENVRTLLLESPQEHITPLTEAYLFAAARASHCAEVIDPALRSGHVVVSDRFLASSVAYQGAGRQLGEDLVSRLNAPAVAGLRPDLTIVLDLDPELGAHRRRARQHSVGEDRIESAGYAFHTRLRNSFLAQAAADPVHHLVLDATGEVSDIARTIAQRVQQDLLARALIEPTASTGPAGPPESRR